VSKGIPRIELKDVADQGVALLEQAGCLVVTDVATDEQRAALRL